MRNTAWPSVSCVWSASNPVSRAATLCTTVVSLFRENVRLNGQHKCHSVRVPWYQMLTSRGPPRVAASEDPRRPGISSRWLGGFPTRARSLEATSPCAWLSESPSIAPSQGTSACAQRWLWACRRRPRCRLSRASTKHTSGAEQKCTTREVIGQRQCPRQLFGRSVTEAGWQQAG